jgi:predicted transcriptional regulator
MTITLSPETEAKLRERAERDGQEIDALADFLLSAALDEEARDREEAIEGIRRGLEAGAAGRVRPAEAVFAGLRSKLRSLEE